MESGPAEGGAWRSASGASGTAGANPAQVRGSVFAASVAPRPGIEVPASPRLGIRIEAGSEDRAKHRALQATAGPSRGTGRESDPGPCRREARQGPA